MLLIIIIIFCFILLSVNYTVNIIGTIFIINVIIISLLPLVLLKVLFLITLLKSDRCKYAKRQYFWLSVGLRLRQIIFALYKMCCIDCIHNHIQNSIAKNNCFLLVIPCIPYLFISLRI